MEPAKDLPPHSERAEPGARELGTAPGQSRPSPLVSARDRRCLFEIFPYDGSGFSQVAVGVTDRRGNIHHTFSIHDLPAEAVGRAAAPLAEHRVREALNILVHVIRDREASGYPAEIREDSSEPPASIYESEDGRSTIMQTSVRPAGFFDFAEGCDRHETRLTQIDGLNNASRMNIVIETLPDGQASGRVNLDTGSFALEFLLEGRDGETSAAAINGRAFEIMEIFRTEGPSAALDELSPISPAQVQEAYSGVPEMEGADGGIAEWSPEKDRQEQLLDADRERGEALPDPRNRVVPAYPENARTIDRNLPCGASIRAVYNEHEALIFIAPISIDDGDRVIYQIDLPELDGAMNMRRIENIVARLAADDPEKAREAVYALMTLGPWEVYCQPGEAHHPTISELRDLARWDLKGGEWFAFPLEEGNDHDFHLLAGYEFGVFRMNDRAGHEFSRVTFMLDELGNGSVTFATELGAELRFALPPVEGRDPEALFMRRQELKTVLEKFHSNPARAIGDLQEECACEAAQLPFPYDRGVAEAYRNVADVYSRYREHLGEEASWITPSMIEYAGNGVFRAHLPSFSYHGFSTLLDIDQSGVRRVQLWRANPNSLLGIIASKQHYTFEIDAASRDGLSLEKIFDHLTPRHAGAGELCAEKLVGYLREFATEHQGLLGRLRTYLQGLGLWRHPRKYN